VNCIPIKRIESEEIEFAPEEETEELALAQSRGVDRNLRHCPGTEIMGDRTSRRSKSGEELAVDLLNLAALPGKQPLLPCAFNWEKLS
jgi:hypothetical protein